MDKIINKDKFQEQWEKSQIANWKNDETEIINFFVDFGVAEKDIKEILQEIYKQDYEKQQKIFYLLHKIQGVFEICIFLDERRKSKHKDCDRQKLFLLISHAEIASKINHDNNNPLTLLRYFFNSVKDELKYKIKMNSDISENIKLDYLDILYALRNEYAHQGDTAGRIFNDERGDSNCNLTWVNYWDENNKKMIEVYFLVGISCKKYYEIYLRALISQIKKYLYAKTIL